MPRSKHDRPKANRVFTNREKPIALFNAARAGLDPARHQVLAFHGIGGQGKTALRKRLAQILAGEDPRRAVWGVLDCQVFDQAARGLLELRKTLRDSGPVRCTAFDVAIAVYWEKAYPTEDIDKALKDLLNDHEGVLGAIADNAPAWLELAQTLPAGLGLGVKALRLARKKYKDSAAKRQVEALQGIEHLDATQLLDKLPYFLAVDLRELGDTRQPVIFLDTYEALWSDKPDKTGLATVETDAWVRELVAAAPGVLFVVFGRDRLSWHERFPEDGWGGCLEQHRLDGLSEADADQFLRLIPVAEPAIRAAMVKAAQGAAESSPSPAGRGVGEMMPAAHPFYLDLSVDTYLVWTSKTQAGPRNRRISAAPAAKSSPASCATAARRNKPR